MPRHPIVYVAVDVVAFAMVDGVLQVLVIERAEEPWVGESALPGGFVRPGEDLDAAAARELAEETGIAEPLLEQLRSYGAPERDPRARTVSVAYLAVLATAPTPVAGSDAVAAAWRPLDDVRRDGLAFDHDEILDDAVERLASKLEYTTVACGFLPESFTLAELREVYEVVWGRPLDAGNFQRRVRRGADFVEPTGGVRAAGRGRPAELFRAIGRPPRALESPLVRTTV